MTIKIGLIGDYSPQVTAHIAIPQALQLAADETECEVKETWLATDEILGNFKRLSDFDARWCVPASPYKSMDGALAAIKFAREKDVPFLGTCGGFQHAVIEYARNVLGFTKADHTESNPETSMPLMTQLSCSLVKTEATIKLKENSRTRRIYEADEIIEQYHCNFGFNQEYEFLFEKSEMKITGADANGEPSVVELASHPFFVATLFQPERSALSGKAHPLILAFIEAAKLFQNGKRMLETKNIRYVAEV
ncbi:MAG: CTP synthase [Acidobacteriota bacterium]